MFHILDHLGRLLSGRKQQGSVMHENLSCSLQLVFCFILVLISFPESQIETGENAWSKVQWLYIQILSTAVYTIPAIYLRNSLKSFRFSS